MKYVVDINVHMCRIASMFISHTNDHYYYAYISHLHNPYEPYSNFRKLPTLNSFKTIGIDFPLIPHIPTG